MRKSALSWKKIWTSFTQRIMDLRTALDDQRNQTNEYKELYEDAKDAMEDLKASTASKISEKTNAMRSQTNKEIIALRTQLESTKRNFKPCL